MDFAERIVLNSLKIGGAALVGAAEIYGQVTAEKTAAKAADQANAPVTRLIGSDTAGRLHQR
jgi:hypothetical protein